MIFPFTIKKDFAIWDCDSNRDCLTRWPTCHSLRYRKLDELGGSGFDEYITRVHVYFRRHPYQDYLKQHYLYVNTLVGDTKDNLKDFYRYINSQKKDTRSIPPLKRKSDSGLQSESEQADEFNGQITDVFNNIEHSQVPAPFMEDIPVSAERLTKFLRA